MLTANFVIHNLIFFSLVKSGKYAEKHQNHHECFGKYWAVVRLPSEELKTLFTILFFRSFKIGELLAQPIFAEGSNSDRVTTILTIE